MTPRLASTRVGQASFSQIILKPRSQTLAFLHISVPGTLGLTPKLRRAQNYACTRANSWFPPQLTDEVGSCRRGEEQTGFLASCWTPAPLRPANSRSWKHSNSATSTSLKYRFGSDWPNSKEKRNLEVFLRANRGKHTNSVRTPCEPSASQLGMAGSNVDSANENVITSDSAQPGNLAQWKGPKELLCMRNGSTFSRWHSNSNYVLLLAYVHVRVVDIRFSAYY